MLYTRKTIATGNIVAGQQTDLTANLSNLDDEVADRPGAVVAIDVEMTLNLNSAGGGAGITGRNMFDVIHSILVKTGHPREKAARVNNLLGGHCRVLETQMVGVEPDVPADLAAAAGAATRQITVRIPLCDLGGERPKDHAAPIDLLKKAGSFSFVFANSPSALGGNANDTIAGGTFRIVALEVPLDEGEVPQPISIRWMDRNGTNDVNTIDLGRYRYATVVQQGAPGTGHTGGEFAAGTITQIDTLAVGKNKLAERVTARSWMQGFNKDRIIDAASRRGAPDDTATAVTDFFPLLWPTRGGSGLAIPFGALTFFTVGTNQNWRILVVEPLEALDEDRKEVLVTMGYDRAAVEAVPAAKRVPKTLRPGLVGHLNMDLRKRGLLPQVWHGLGKQHRKKIARD